MIRMGININCKKYAFIDWMFQHLKTVETRNTPSLRPYVGQRVGLVQTGRGKAMLRGYATIAEEIRYNTEAGFYNDAWRHMIDRTMLKYIFKNGVKYGYVLTDIEEIDPVPVNTRGIVARKIA